MKKALFIAVALLATMTVTAQTVYQNGYISVSVNDTNYGTVRVVNPVITYDTVGDVIDTIRNETQWLFFPIEKDTNIRLNCFVAEVFGDSNYIDTLFDNFYFFDTIGHDSLALHAYFYNPQLGLPEIDDSDVFTVYPNPTGSIVNFNRIIKVPVYVFSMDGKMVLSTINANRIDMTGLPKGMYIIRMKGYTFRVIKL
jgi:hypothetical protein